MGPLVVVPLKEKQMDRTEAVGLPEGSLVSWSDKKMRRHIGRLRHVGHKYALVETGGNDLPVKEHKLALADITPFGTREAS
jgi:hypothetical protein